MNRNKFRKYFGTDGIRGKVGKFPMTAEIALKIGIAVGIKFSSANNQKLHRVVIGKDTRLSGYVIESAITAGLASVGIEVFLVGFKDIYGIFKLEFVLLIILSVILNISN